MPIQLSSEKYEKTTTRTQQLHCIMGQTDFALFFLGRRQKINTIMITIIYHVIESSITLISGKKPPQLIEPG